MSSILPTLLHVLEEKRKDAQSSNTYLALPRTADRDSRLALDLSVSILSHQSTESFLAHKTAHAAITRGDDCPLSGQLLKDCHIVHVAKCGHVCGPIAKNVDFCPICHTEAKWVEITYQHAY